MLLPCSSCSAACCRQNGHAFAVMILPEDSDTYQTETFTDSLETFQAIPYRDGKCLYLNGNQCTIYDTRPILCKEFNCIDGYKLDGNHSFFLQDNEPVIQLIEKLGILGAR